MPDTYTPDNNNDSSDASNTPRNASAGVNQRSMDVNQSQNTAKPTEQNHVIKRTGASDVLIALTTFFIVLLLIVVFIFQNMDSVNVSFLWMHGSLPIALAMLLAVISGALLMALAAGARVLQLRHTAARHRQNDTNI